MERIEKNFNRRNFLRMTAMAGAGAAFLPTNVAAASNTTPKVLKKQEDEIPVRTLGRTGIYPHFLFNIILIIQNNMLYFRNDEQSCICMKKHFTCHACIKYSHNHTSSMRCQCNYINLLFLNKIIYRIK